MQFERWAIVLAVTTGCTNDTPSGVTCGPGTTDDGAGQCVPDGTAVCTGGLVFDVVSGQCVPGGCMDPFVVVAGVCADPTAGLGIDVEEGPEPNGLGMLGEMSSWTAGTIALKPVGSYTVVHGTIHPTVDRDGDGSPDPDVDAYAIHVDAPTLLEITADGTRGLAAGFAVLATNVAPDDPLVRWRRLGINLAGDMSTRQVFLPRAGTYALGIADTRSLFIAAGAAGDGDYYVSIAVKDVPAPTALVPSAGDHGQIAGDVKFYSTPALGDGLAEIDVMTTSNAAQLAIGVYDNGSLHNEGYERFGDVFGSAFKLPADLVFGGIKPGDATIVVVDSIYNYALSPVDYDVSKLFEQPAIPLGGTITDAVHNNFYEVLKDTNLYYFDVSAADEIQALTWHSTIQLDAKVVDEYGRELSDFTTNGGAFDHTGFTDYRGLMRFPRAGRYYFVAVADVGDDFGIPANAVGDPFQITTSIAKVTPPALALGTPLTAQPILDVNTAVFACDPGSEPWYGFTLRQSAGSASTGTLQFALYDPATMYGRLDNLSVRHSANLARPPTVQSGDPFPDLVYAVPASGATFGELAIGAGSHYLVKVNPSTTTGARSIDIAMAARAYTDFATMVAGDDQTRAGEQLTDAAPTKLYLVKANPGTRVTITVTPDPSLDAAIDTLFADESTNLHADADGPGGVEVLTFTQPDTGGTPSYTAFAISAPGGFTSPASYDLEIRVDAATHYTASAGTTAYADACIDGTVVPFVYGAAGGPPNYDEGLTDVVNLPSPAFDDFHYFGERALDSDGDGSPDMTISTNGWLSLDAYAVFDPMFANVHIPDAADPAMVAPYWDDIDKVTVCTKAIGSDFIVQWTGVAFDPLDHVPPRIAVQAVFHAIDNTIEFVYAADHAGLADSATIGVGDVIGVNGTEVSYDTPRPGLAGSSIKLAPN